MDQHNDASWLRHMGRMFLRWSKEAKTDEERENCLRLSNEFRSMAVNLETS